MSHDAQPYLDAVRASMTEAQLQANVLDAMRTLRWRAYHTHDSRRSEWGFPDLCAVRGHRLLFAELKSTTGRLSPMQAQWITDLEGTDAEVYVWRPEDWTSGGIVEVLR